jgi:aryl-alcohol dehydrogenase-like predicted oxidoreductase
VDSSPALTDLVRGQGPLPRPLHLPGGRALVDAQYVARARGRERFVTEQPTYSILTRTIENEILPLTQRYGMGVLSYSPLAGGWLSGRRRGAAGVGRCVRS